MGSMGSAHFSEGGVLVPRPHHALPIPLLDSSTSFYFIFVSTLYQNCPEYILLLPILYTK